MSAKPQRDLFEAMQQVKDWLFNDPKRATVNREWDQQYIADAAQMLLDIHKPKLMDLEHVKKVCVFSNGVLRYVKNPGRCVYWCEVHHRPADWIRLPNGIEDPMYMCDPNLAGITMPCRVIRRV